VKFRRIEWISSTCDCLLLFSSSNIPFFDEIMADITSGPASVSSTFSNVSVSAAIGNGDSDKNSDYLLVVNISCQRPSSSSLERKSSKLGIELKWERDRRRKKAL